MLRCAIVLAAALLGSCGGSAAAAPNFTLLDDGARSWTLAAQHKAVLLTFGFTHCADTCPATLARLSRLSHSLASRGDGVEIALVTVDPARDTPRALHAFVARFAPLTASRVVGLTGSRAQIAAVESAYHVWSAPTHRREKAAKGYDVAHSAQIFFITRDGRLASIHDDDDSSATLARALQDIAG
ncbi:MAG: SCO family protein [Candidatus Eremiobacteraeota bacterium]|nr:SCO family protein [Candidatus Eremiobacteraeota bacterium]